MGFSRIDQLLEFLKESPDDPFNLYALALEYQKINSKDDAEFYYEKLLREHSSYIATYYHAGKFYQQSGKKELAKSTFSKGLEESRRAGNNHAFRELQNALNELLFEDQEDE